MSGTCCVFCCHCTYSYIWKTFQLWQVVDVCLCVHVYVCLSGLLWVEAGCKWYWSCGCCADLSQENQGLFVSCINSVFFFFFFFFFFSFCVYVTFRFPETEIWIKCFVQYGRAMIMMITEPVIFNCQLSLVIPPISFCLLECMVPPPPTPLWRAVCKIKSSPHSVQNCKTDDN